MYGEDMIRLEMRFDDAILSRGGKPLSFKEVSELDPDHLACWLFNFYIVQFHKETHDA